MRKIRKLKKERIIAEWGVTRVKASKSPVYQEFKKAYNAKLAEHSTDLDEWMERIGWNSFRHTFGSILAQDDVSLDKISSWMGNTPEVCRRHYAQFVPRNRRDEDIDRL